MGNDPASYSAGPPTGGMVATASPNDSLADPRCAQNWIAADPAAAGLPVGTVCMADPDMSPAQWSGVPPVKEDLVSGSMPTQSTGMCQAGTTRPDQVAQAQHTQAGTMLPTEMQAPASVAGSRGVHGKHFP